LIAQGNERASLRQSVRQSEKFEENQRVGLDWPDYPHLQRTVDRN
jgi:hypothetical protein